MVATFTGNDRTVRICDHKAVPIGFFIQDYDQMFAPYVSGTSDMAGIAVGQGEYRTDTMESGTTYKVNDFLYCSDRGRLTNEDQYQGNIIVGIVNQVNEGTIGFLACMARGLEPFGALRLPPGSGISRYEIAQYGGK